MLEKKVSAEEVNQAMKNAAANNESFGYTEEEIVSSDVIGSHFGSIYDATQLEIAEVGDLQLVKTVAGTITSMASLPSLSGCWINSRSKAQTTRHA